MGRVSERGRPRIKSRLRSLETALNVPGLREVTAQAHREPYAGVRAVRLRESRFEVFLPGKNLIVPVDDVEEAERNLTRSDRSFILNRLRGHILVRTNVGWRESELTVSPKTKAFRLFEKIVVNEGEYLEIGDTITELALGDPKEQESQQRFRVLKAFVNERLYGELLPHCPSDYGVLYVQSTLRAAIIRKRSLS